MRFEARFVRNLPSPRQGSALRRVCNNASTIHESRCLAEYRRRQLMKFREIVRRIEDDGWQRVAQRGSHRQYEHPTEPGKVTVAGRPGADVPIGTAVNILRQAGLWRRQR